MELSDDFLERSHYCFSENTQEVTYFGLHDQNRPRNKILITNRKRTLWLQRVWGCSRDNCRKRRSSFDDIAIEDLFTNTSGINVQDG